MGETVYSAQDLLEIVWRETGVPLYAAWEFLLRHGMIGSKLINNHTLPVEKPCLFLDKL